ncbi:MAG: cryptochrome/photolyase family protein [Methanocella sp.]
MTGKNISAFIMGDQLNFDISSLRDGPENVVMIESIKKCQSGKWHKRRIAFVISAMRHFGDELKKKGYNVDYYRWAPDFTSALREHVEKEGIKTLYVMKPKNHTAINYVSSLSSKLPAKVEVTENNQFMCPHEEFDRWLQGRKLPRLQHFYRMMRKTRDVLMDGNVPAGGVWTYERENRKSPPPCAQFPPPPEVKDDAVTGTAVQEVLDRFPDSYGELESLGMPVDRPGAIAWEEDFIRNKLPEYGPFEFAMESCSTTLFHSMTSPLLNAGLLSPHECVAMAVSAYEDGRAPISSVEGYVKRVMGWREYIAGMYGATAPGILGYNYFDNRRHLPPLFEDESLTAMNCVWHTIRAIRETGYANHSMRLMVLGNFALLAGIDPRELYDWFLKTNIDGCEWATAPNVICLSQYADGGKVAMKPYVSSAGFINTMSDYCGKCHYDPDKKTGEDACPFNYLYWNFIGSQQTYQIKNCRLTIPHREWEQAGPENKEAMEYEAEMFLDEIENPKKPGRESETPSARSTGA